jgi:hypothetical protein
VKVPVIIDQRSLKKAFTLKTLCNNMSLAQFYLPILCVDHTEGLRGEWVGAGGGGGYYVGDATEDASDQ